jgi:hypothetical protein
MRVTHLRINHRGDDGGEFNADDVPFTPAGTISSTNVQAAIEEVSGDVNAAGMSVIVPLTNKSGGTVNAGDVVIVDTTADECFTTTTTASLETSIGIALATIANNGVGDICVYGYVPVVNTNSVSVTRGRYLFTSTGAKQATGSATRAPGAFGQVLSTAANPNAWLWGVADQSGGSVTEITDLPTAETDTSLVLHPDGLGGVEWDTDATGGGLSDHAHTGTGDGGDDLDVNTGTLRLPVGTGALTTTEGYAGWQSATERFRVYDGQRERSMSSVGWVPFAFPISFVPTAAFTTTLTLPANGGAIAIPMWVPGHMLLHMVDWRNTDTGTQRTVDWSLYLQHLNDGNGAENTLDRVATSTGQLIYTPSAASIRGIDADPVTYLAPGLYWLVIQNQHATNTYGLGSTAASSAYAVNTAQTLTATNPIGSTLDFTGWSKVTAVYAARLVGRVFGQTTNF